MCPRLARLALRCCSSVHVQEALRRMVGFVQGRNPARAGGAGAWMGVGVHGVASNVHPSSAGSISSGGHSSWAGHGQGAAQVSFLTGKPVRLEELEMVGCTRIEPDIGHWLESRIPNIVCQSSEP